MAIRYFKPGDIVICIETESGYTKGCKYKISLCDMPCYPARAELSREENCAVIKREGEGVDSCSWANHDRVFPCFKLVTNKVNHLPEWL